MNKNFLLVALLFASTSLVAQTAVSVTSIYFETDQSELSVEACQALDAMVPAMVQAPDYQVNIEAFTDERGTASYNLRLAADRAASVEKYLASKGLIAEKTSVKNWGEQKSSGATDLDRQKHRRVDVAINAFFFKDFESLQNRLSANTGQYFKIKVDQEQTITSARGTWIEVPAYAFVFEDGTTPMGEVDVFVQEAFDPSDFVLHKLTTRSDGRILQTGGMLCIKAQSEGRELRLSEGSALTLSIPNAGKFDPNMELFYAQTTEDDGLNWKPAGQNFLQTSRIGRVRLKIDPSLGRRIAALKVPEYPKPTLPFIKDEMPPAPKMPVLPYKPHAPKKPEWTAVQKIYGGGGDAAQMSRKELKKAEIYFAEQLKRYERDSAKYVLLDQRYHQNMKKYQQSTAQFTQLQKDWEVELNSQLQAILIYQRKLGLFNYAQSLTKALKIKAKTIQQYGTYSNLYGSVAYTAECQSQMSMLGSGFSTDSRKTAKEAGTISSKLIELQELNAHAGFINSTGSLKDVMSEAVSDSLKRQMLASTGLKAISDSLETELNKKREAFSSTTLNQLNATMDGYMCSITQLGWVNCDRFYNDTRPKMQVFVSESEESTLYAVCKEINAMLPFSRNDDGTYSVEGLPKGRIITIVGIKIKDGMPQYAQRVIKVGDTTKPTLAYRSMTLRDLKGELKKLNG